MFIVNKIIRAINFLGPHYDYWGDDSAIGETIHSLVDFVENQPSILDDQYLGFRNWDWARLRDEGGYFRKPRIKTEAYVTSKDNMVLEWYPVAWERVSFAVNIDNPEEQRRMDERRRSIEDEIRGDFLSFSELAPDFGRPDNRLLHLSGPWHLNLRTRRTRRKDPFFEASQILMKAVHGAYAHLYSLLESQFELTKVHDLYLKETKEGLAFVFLNVEEEEK